MAQFIPNDIMNSKAKPTFVIETYQDTARQDQSRGSSGVARGTHNPEVEGATPSPATISSNIILGYN